MSTRRQAKARQARSDTGRTGTYLPARERWRKMHECADCGKPIDPFGNTTDYLNDGDDYYCDNCATKRTLR